MDNAPALENGGRRRRLARRKTIRKAIDVCELKTFTEMYRRSRNVACRRLENPEHSDLHDAYSRISQWSDETFRKCLSNGHVLYGVCIGLFCQTFAETGIWSNSPEVWAERILGATDTDFGTQITKTPDDSTSFSDVASETTDGWSKYNDHLARAMHSFAPGSKIPIGRLYLPLRAKYGDTLQRSPHLIAYLSRKQQRAEDGDMRKSW